MSWQPRQKTQSQRFTPWRSGFSLAVLVGLVIVTGCGGGTSSPEGKAPDSQGAQNPEAVAETPIDPTNPGTLQIRANGEDFVRQGFVSKDGWTLKFNQVYVNLSEITAYQTETAFDPDADLEPQATTQVTLPGPYAVDLAAGDENEEPIVVGEVAAPAGQYTALAWQMPTIATGEWAGQVLVLVGTAEKAGQTIDFTLKIDRPYGYQCGEYVGDARKGIVSPGGRGDLEMTFHFDHLFGDGTISLEDDLNQGALGFEPLAALAGDDRLDFTYSQLQTQLAPEDAQTLEKALLGLGHVGEGHCKLDPKLE